MGTLQSLLPGSAKILLGLFLPALASGCCQGIGYTIEMEVTQAGFNRSVAVVSHQEASPEDGESPASPLPEGLRTPFLAVYGPGEPIEQGEKFSSSFNEATPNDVGGPGMLLRVTSGLGTAFYYHERFGGSFPTLRARKLREQAVDGYFDWLTDWLRQDLDSDENATRIIDFVGGPLRADAHDLVCLFDGLAVAKSDSDRGKGEPQGLLQIGHFLTERGYLTPRKLALLCLSNLSDDEQKRHAIEAVRTRLCDAAEVSSDAPIIKRLFDDPENTWERFGDYLRTQPEFQRLVEREATSGKQGEVKPNDLIGEQLTPVMISFFGHALSCRQDLDVMLRTSVKPFSTNGVWDEESQAIRWSEITITGKNDAPTAESDTKSAESASMIDAAVTGLPIVLIAGWAVPDQQRQAEWFGKTVFEGEELADYCTWHQRLSDEAADEWQTCIDELRRLPPPARDERLQQFLAPLPPPAADQPLLKKITSNLLSDR